MKQFDLKFPVELCGPSHTQSIRTLQDCLQSTTCHEVLSPHCLPYVHNTQQRFFFQLIWEKNLWFLCILFVLSQRQARWSILDWLPANELTFPKWAQADAAIKVL